MKFGVDRFGPQKIWLNLEVIRNTMWLFYCIYT